VRGFASSPDRAVYWVAMLYYLLVAVYILVCVLLLIVVLLQQGKGGDIAAAFGGAGSQTAFGARSGATFLTRATAVLGALFVLGSLGLGIMKKNGAGGSVMSGVAAPAASKSAVPALPTTSAPPPIPASAPSASGTSGTSGGSAPAAGGSQSKTPVAPGAKKGGGQ
jgi:preprotein translocase subunit SecG